MVGSVLMQRMQEERDFDHIDAVFFTTSNVGGQGPAIAGKASGALKDARSIDDLKAMDALQGGTRTCNPGWSPRWDT